MTVKRPAWAKYFGMKAAPFSKDIDDGDLWLPSSKTEIVTNLVEAMKEHQHAIMVGEPGIGKTCTLRALRKKLPESKYRLVYCHNATLGRRDFYRHLCLALGIESKASAAAVFYALSNHVQELARDTVHPVFLLDEAQLIKDDVLRHLHILANYEWDRRPLLSIVLVGLPDLWRRLSLGVHRSLWSRIQHRVALEQPNAADTTEYLIHRLERVGGKQTIFASATIALLHEATSGQLRDVDRIATECLRLAAKRQLKIVDADVFQAVVDRDHALS